MTLLLIKNGKVQQKLEMNNAPPSIYTPIFVQIDIPMHEIDTLNLLKPNKNRYDRIIRLTTGEVLYNFVGEE